MHKNNWIDISQPLSSDLAHWPDDTPFSYNLTYTKDQTGSVNIGSITTSLHSGTHVDAPFHFQNDGEKILDLDINIFIGHCRMIDVSSFKVLSQQVFEKYDLSGINRLLLRTNIANNPTRFPEEIPYLTKDAAEYLHRSNIQLVGVDVPSVDALDSKELDAHHAMYEKGIHILENLMLDQVEPGDYELIALPLPLKDADGSPVRAVIRPI